jgi:2'-hydroxyisoflavone reductase
VDVGEAAEFRPENYGALKTLCERAAEETPGRTLIVRSGLLAGPFDPTGRLPYWIQRVADGGEVLAPGAPERQLQLIDARDMAEWIVRMAESRRAGVFNVSGPERPLTMGHLLDAIRKVTGSVARFTWVDEHFLLENGVAPWTELPLWLPEESGGMLSVSLARAVEAGLDFRPLEETIRDTLAWMRPGWSTGTLASGIPLRAGLSRERETTLLKDWRTIR